MENGPKPHESAVGGNRFGFQTSGPLTDVNINQSCSQTSPVYDPSLFIPSKNPPQMAHSRSPGFSRDGDSPFENDVLNDMGMFSGLCFFDNILTLFSRHRRAVA